MKRVLVMIGSLCAAAILVLAAEGCGRATKPVRLAMGYIPNVQFAPWYVAEEKGYFKQAGLDITLDYAKVNDIMRLLAAGKIDFAIAGGDEVIVARGQGLPVTYVMALYAKFPAVVLSLEKAGIHEPADLKGKRIGLPGFYGSNYVAIKAILAGAGLEEADVDLRPIGYTQTASLTEGVVDAAVCFANNEPVQLRQRGIVYRGIYAYDYFDLVGHGIVTGGEMIRRDPAKVRAFVSATRKGMEYAIKHPDEAFEICHKYAPEAGGPNRESQYAVMLESMKLWESGSTEKHGLGYSEPSAWERSQELMRTWGMISKKAAVSHLMSNAFLR